MASPVVNEFTQCLLKKVTAILKKNIYFHAHFIIDNKFLTKIVQYDMLYVISLIMKQC